MSIPVALLNDTRVDQHHGCEFVVSAIEALLEHHGLQVHARSHAHNDWQRDKSFLDKSTTCRLLLINGEGTLHHDRPAARRLLEAGAYARNLGIPAVLINTGWEANGPDLVAKLADFDLISARDTVSAQTLIDAGHACRVVPDLSLYAPAPEADGFARQGIGFTDSVDRFKALKIEACRRRMRGQSVPISYADRNLVGMLRYLRQGASLRADLPHPQRLLALMGMRYRQWVVSLKEPGRFMQQLATLQFLVTGRFHACTLALKVGLPFMALESNSRKISSLIADVGLEPHRMVETLVPERILSAAAEGWSQQEMIAIDDYCAQARTSAEALFRDIRALC